MTLQSAGPFVHSDLQSISQVENVFAAGSVTWILDRMMEVELGVFSECYRFDRVELII